MWFYGLAIVVTIVVWAACVFIGLGIINIYEKDK